MKTVEIGTKKWMAENLDVEHFRNGDPIPHVAGENEWEKAGNEGKPAWCFYFNQLKKGEEFGKLYNWHAVNDPRGLAPEGWRIPNIKEFTDLVAGCLNMREVDLLELESSEEGHEKGIKACEILGKGGSSGFNALMAGRRLVLGGFEGIRHITTFWIDNSYGIEDNSEAWGVDLVHRIECRPYPSGMGFSVRCIEDDDAIFLQAEPISRKRMDLLWLDPARLAQLGQLLAQHEVVTINMGSTDSNVQDYEITREDFEWAKQIEQIVDKAYSAGQNGNFNQSCSYYKEALHLAPGCDLFLMSIGVCYAEAGQKAKGLQYLKRAAQISPGNTRIRKNLDKVIGKKQSAEPQPKKALPVSGGHAEADKPLYCPNCSDKKRETTPRYAVFICDKCGTIVSIDDYIVSTASKSNKQGLFSLTGRIGRATFWSIWFVMMIVSLFVGLIIGGISSSGDEGAAVAIVIYLLFLIPCVWIGLAMQVKRWHDRNKSGWMVLINFIPIIGWFWALIELGFLQGTIGPNQYGEDPLQLSEKKSEAAFASKELTGVPSARAVENVVDELRKNPPDRELCFIVLFGDRPLAAIAVDDENDILCFTERSEADDFVHGYQRIYNTTKPLSILAVGEVDEIWAMLNNKARDEQYKGPFGLLINFSYAGGSYNRYSVADLKRIGLDGLKKGFSMLS